MKKRGLALLLAGMVLLCSCGQKADPSGYKSEEADPGGAGMKRVVTSGVTNGYERGYRGTSSWFIVKPDSFIAEVEKRAADKEITKFEVEVNKFGKHTYSINGSRVVEIREIVESDTKDSSDIGYINEIRMSAHGSSEEAMKYFSIVSHIVIDLLNPSLAKQIEDDLHIYDKDQSEWPPSRVVECGNARYVYHYDGRSSILTITATKQEFKTSTPKAPTRQE